LILFGGGVRATTPGSYQNDLWEWNGSVWTQRTNILGSAPSGRGEFFSAFDSNRGRLVIYGGLSTTGTYLNDLYEYDGTSWYSPTPVGGPGARASESTEGGQTNAAFDNIHNRFILYGGYDGASFHDDIFTWDGFAWTQQCTACTGAVRGGAYTAFDASRDKIVVAQGSNGVARSRRSGERERHRQSDLQPFLRTNDVLRREHMRNGLRLQRDLGVWGAVD
jgi:hypothetical protein